MMGKERAIREARRLKKCSISFRIFRREIRISRADARGIDAKEKSEGKNSAGIHAPTHAPGA
jgi:hypothetical protein